MMFNGMNEALLSPLMVNKEATIISGVCRGINGIVVSANWSFKTVTLRTEEGTSIITEWHRVLQER